VSGNLSSHNARDCLKSLKANTPPELVREEIIIEAGIRPDFNHAEEINKAIRLFSGDYLVLLDDDVVLEPGWIEGLVKCAEQYEGAGVIGAVLKNRRGEIISSGGDVTDTYFGVDQKEPVLKPVERKYVTSAVMLITRKAAECIGPFDVGFRKYGQDADYCFRAWEAGFKVLVTPDSQAVHLVGETVNLRQDMKDLWEKDREFFYKKWRQSSIYKRFEVIDLTRRCVLHLASACTAGNDNDAGEKIGRRSLEEMVRETDGLRNRDHLDYIDIAGGEPAEYKHLCELVAHCGSIGLLPTIITNGQQHPDVYEGMIDAGLEDMLICVRAPGGDGAVDRINKTVDVLKVKKFGFRTDTAFPDLDFKGLPELAGELIAMRPRMANFIFFDPHEGHDISKGGFRSKYADVAPCLKEAVDRLMAGGIWTNVRYFPLCLLKGYEQHVCNAHQRPWDPYEWDNLPGYKPDKKETRKIGRSAGKENLYGIFPEDRMKLWIAKHRACARNIFFEQCGLCANRAICDGVHPRYAAEFGSGGFVPLEGEMIRDPMYYRKKNQSWRMMKPRPDLARPA
jgi:hypothetical protein